MRERACKNCGGKSYEVVGQNMVKCQFCGTLYVDEHASKEEEVLLVGAYELAREQKFDEAIKEFDKILTLYPLSFESFYGRCLARHKIVFYTSRVTKKPRFFGDEIPSILEDEDFLSAVKNAPAEVIKTYQDQAKKIEKLHETYLENKDTTFDVVLADPRLDKENSTTLQGVENLQKEGIKTYFLQQLKEKENETLTFIALKTCKAFVMFANDKKGYENAEIKNLYDRYLYFMSLREKSRTSLILCLNKEKISISELPEQFSSCKNPLDLNSSSFIEDFVARVKEEIINTTEEIAKIETVIVENSTPQKKEYVDVENIQPTELGHYHVDNVKLTEENKIKWMFLALKNGDFQSAEEVLKAELSKNAVSSDVLLAQMMLKRKIRTQEELFSSIANFQDKDEIDKILAVSSKEFAEYFVDSVEKLIERLDNVDHYNKYLLYFAGFSTPNREDFVKMAENKAVETQDEELIEKVLKCFKPEEVDRFINFYFMLAQKTDDRSYYDKILQIDEGHEQSNMALLLSRFKTNEELLNYRNKEEIEEIFKFLNEQTRTRFVKAVINMILPVAFLDLQKAQAQFDFYLSYVTDNESLVEILREISIQLQRMRFFKLAERYISIAISKKPDVAEFYWLLISIKAHCISDSEMIMTINKITQFPEWETLLSVADEKETEKYASIASKINLYEGQKIPIKEEFLDKNQILVKLKAFLLRNEKILLEMQKQDEKFKRGVNYYTLQIQPFYDYLKKLETVETHTDFEDVSRKIFTRLDLLNLNLNASINVTHLLSREEGLKVANSVATSQAPIEKLSSETKTGGHKKFWMNFSIGMLGFLPTLFTALLLLITIIMPKQVYLYFSQNFLIISLIYCVALGMCCFGIFSIKKHTLSKKWKWVNLSIFSVACLNIFLFALGFYFIPKTLEISTASEFNTLIHNAPFSKFVLEEDLDLSNIDWKTVNFTGSLDGQNHTIENLKFSTNASMFGRNSGEVCNLNIVLAEKTYKTGFSPIARTNSGTIENCSVSGTVTLILNEEMVSGGLVATNNSIIKNCTVNLTITLQTSKTFTFGGIAGVSEKVRDDAQILKCESNVTLDAELQNSDELNFGGLVGKNYQTVSRSQSNIDVTIHGTAQNVVAGGLFGKAYVGNENNFAIGKFDLKNLNSTGCFGGLAGEYKNSNRISKISHSYAIVEIEGHERFTTGSLVGNLEGYVDSCFSNQGLGFYGTKILQADATNCQTLYSGYYNSNLGFDTEIWQISNDEYPKLK